MPEDARASLGAQVPHPSRLGDPDEFGIDKAGIAHIRFTSPGASNALHPELAAAFESRRRRHRGPNFCAGGDVMSMAIAHDKRVFLSELAGKVHRALVTLESLPLPAVAAVQGAAAGAGLGLVLAADFVVAGRSRSFAAAYAAVGLSPDCGVSALLPRIVGTRRAAQMLLTGRALSGVEALD
nr:enoyl-CoA hydratase-related protein [Rhodococcus sp. 14-2483-1-2]